MLLTFQEVSEAIKALTARIEKLERRDQLQDEDLASVRTEIGRLSGLAAYLNRGGIQRKSG